MSRSEQKLMSKNTKTKKIDTNKSFLSEMNPKLKVSSQHCGSVKDEVNRFEIEEGLDVQLHMGNVATARAGGKARGAIFKCGRGRRHLRFLPIVSVGKRSKRRKKRNLSQLKLSRNT